MHNFIPVLSSYNPEQHGNTFGSCAKVGMSADPFPIFHSAEKDHTSESIEDNQEKHSHNNKETLVDGDNHREHQHFQGCVLPCDGEKAENDHSVAEC